MKLKPLTKQLIIAGAVIIIVTSMFTGHFSELLNFLGGLFV